MFIQASVYFFLEIQDLLYISAWAFCVARSRRVGNAKALKHGTSEGKIPTPSLSIGFLYL